MKAGYFVPGGIKDNCFAAVLSLEKNSGEVDHRWLKMVTFWVFSPQLGVIEFRLNNHLLSVVGRLC